MKTCNKGSNTDWRGQRNSSREAYLNWDTGFRGFLGGAVVKNLPANAGDTGSIPGTGRHPGGGMVTHSSILAWRIPRTEEPGGLQSIGLQRVGHDWRDLAHMHIHIWSYHFQIVLASFCVGLFLLLCFLPREVPLAFVVNLVWWCWIRLNFCFSGKLFISQSHL